MSATAKIFLAMALLATPVLISSASAQQPVEQRVALVIGNSQYDSGDPLATPANDVLLVADAARSAGFTAVVVQTNLNAASFRNTLREFRALADTADVAMVYFAGHGIEGNGYNWLIPTDAVLANERDLPYEAINLDHLVEAISGARLRVVILDACRDNPFGRAWRAGTRAVSRGLTVYEADDLMVIYAASPGQTTLDAGGVNSPFAASVARRLPQPNLPVQLLGGAVRDDIVAATNGAQRPYVNASMTGVPYYLVADSAGPAIASGAVAADPAAVELAVWQRALSANSSEAFTGYLEQYPEGRFRVLAEQNLARLSASASTASQPSGLDAFIGRWRTNQGVLSGCNSELVIMSISRAEISYRLSLDSVGSTQRTYPILEVSEARVRTRTRNAYGFDISATLTLSGDNLEFRTAGGRCRYQRLG